MAATEDRPSSTRSNKGKRELASKAANLQKELKMVRQKLADKEKKLKVMEADSRQMKQKIDNLESWKRKQTSKMASEQKMRTGAKASELEMKAFLEKIQRAIAARLALVGIDFSETNDIRQALDAALRVINQLVETIETKDIKINELTEENEKLKNKLSGYETKINELKAKINEQNETIVSQDGTIKEQSKTIEKYKKENQEQKDEIERLKALLAELREDYESLKADSTTQIEKLTSDIESLGNENADKTNEINRLTALVAELRNEIESLKNTLAERDGKIEELNNLLAERATELKDNTLELEKLRAKVAELEEQLDKLINIPKEDKGCNTLLTGDINHQLSDYPRLLKSIVELRNIIEGKNSLIEKLKEENNELILEIQYLLKKLVGFQPCSTGHSAFINCLSASPSKYLFATGSNDLSVRLWRVDPDTNKSKNKILVCQRSNIDSKVDCIKWNKDGTLLACGTAYNDSPHGYVIIWSMTGDDKFHARYAIRSRPTVRFGRVKAISFSTKSDQYIFCGDITGSVWVFDLNKEMEQAGSGLIGVVQSHQDVIHDLAISVSNKFLFSVSLDQTLAVFELPKFFGGLKANVKEAARVSIKKSLKMTRESIKISKNSKGQRGSIKSKSKRISVAKVSGKGPSLDIPEDKGHEKENSGAIKYSLAEILETESKKKLKHFAGIVIANDSKYPFWKVCVSECGETVICASRKVKIFNINGDPSNKDNIVDGPKIQCTDLDHIRSLKLRNGKLLLARPKVTRAKVFDINSGKELKTFITKKPVVALDFLGDNAHIVLCCQEPSKGQTSAAMKLVKYSNDRIEIEKEKDNNLFVLSVADGASSDISASPIVTEESKDDNDNNGNGNQKKKDNGSNSPTSQSIATSTTEDEKTKE